MTGDQGLNWHALIPDNNRTPSGKQRYMVSILSGMMNADFKILLMFELEGCYLLHHIKMPCHFPSYFFHAVIFLMLHDVGTSLNEN